jgi:hypothetical protein
MQIFYLRYNNMYLLLAAALQHIAVNVLQQEAGTQKYITLRRLHQMYILQYFWFLTATGLVKFEGLRNLSG